MNSTIKPSSERGIALIVVLLLMAVLSGLATGFVMNGQIEVQMGTNEVYYAGARAAAEAGLNRAIVEIIADTTTNFLAGTDGLVNAATPSAAVNNDNGSLAYILGAGPYPIGTTGQYTYTLQILDDDDDALYETPLTAAQVTQMGEDDSTVTNTNDRLILRSTGMGPNGTTVRIARILETVDTITQTATTTPVLSNPALLVNGDLVAHGNIHVIGASGTVHANGNLIIDGNTAEVSVDATSSGTFAANANWRSGGAQGGGRPTINVPNVRAIDYIGHADFKLSSTGQIQSQNASGVWSTCNSNACKNSGWTFSSGTWSLTGSVANAATYYVEGAVQISGSPDGPGNGHNTANLPFSVIATGSITITGTPKFTPENSAKLQFVTDGDLVLQGNTDLDAVSTIIEGQILVREQISIGGNPEFQGRITVQNVTSVSNTVTTNTISGNPTITYNGTLGAISTDLTTYSDNPPTYVNNVSGWMEQ